MFYAFMTALSPSLMFSCAMASMLSQTEALISVDMDRITSINNEGTRNAPISNDPSKGSSPLHEAVAAGNADAVTELLEHAKTLDPEALEKVLIAKDIDGKTPLHLAVIKGSRATVDGWTPRQLATTHAIKALLHKAGA